MTKILSNGDNRHRIRLLSEKERDVQDVKKGVGGGAIIELFIEHNKYFDDGSMLHTTQTRVG